MQRLSFNNNGISLSYLDSGGNAPILIALHAHWMEATTFIPLANALTPKWRVIALDQRGHGYSDHTKTYTRNDYLSDLEAFFHHLKIESPIVLLGNSLGGVNSYHFAAKHPNFVRAIIVEDIGVAIISDVSFSLAWKGTFQTKEELEQKLGERFLPYLKDSIRNTNDGWKLAFDPEEMLESNNLVVEVNHWKEWLASNCPALLIRGKDSRLTTQEHMEKMASLRTNTKFYTLEGGHVIHVDNPGEFTKIVKEFLNSI